MDRVLLDLPVTRPANRSRPVSRLPGLSLALLSLAASACTWSVPADPGLNARARSRDSGFDPAPEPGPSVGPRPLVADDGMRGLYVSRCGGCHEAYAPSSHAASEWPGVVRRMAPRAGVFGAERERLLEWLVANAR